MDIKEIEKGEIKVDKPAMGDREKVSKNQQKKGEKQRDVDIVEKPKMEREQQDGTKETNNKKETTETVKFKGIDINNNGDQVKQAEQAIEAGKKGIEEIQKIQKEIDEKDEQLTNADNIIEKLRDAGITVDKNITQFRKELQQERDNLDGLMRNKKVLTIKTKKGGTFY